TRAISPTVFRSFWFAVAATWDVCPESRGSGDGFFDCSFPDLFITISFQFVSGIRDVPADDLSGMVTVGSRVLADGDEWHTRFQRGSGGCIRRVAPSHYRCPRVDERANFVTSCADDTVGL